MKVWTMFLYINELRHLRDIGEISQHEFTAVREGRPVVFTRQFRVPTPVRMHLIESILT